MGISLPSIISSGMVIEKRARIWGACDEGNSVPISFNKKEYRVPIKAGKWEVFVESDDFGGPYEMRIGDMVLRDVYVGYVFMLCGQSNMEMPSSRVRIRYEDDFKNLEHNPRVRAFQVGNGYEFSGPRSTCGGAWKAAGPETIDGFYAISFYLSQRLKALNAPIGLIECAVGGSRIESWMKEDSILYEGYSMELTRLCGRKGFPVNIENEDLIRAKAWQDAVTASDTGLSEHYHADGYDHGAWPVRPLTRNWANDIGLLHGAVWFRRTFTVPPEMIGSPARMFLGTISDSDTVFVNGETVGETGYKYPPRCYPVRPGLLREGENTIAVRVVSERQYGGFTAGKEYHIINGEGCVNLNGEWAYKIGCIASELKPPIWFFSYPTGLYNAMLAPVMPHSISAFLWYQGESNDQSPHGYGRLLNRFLQDLRDNYGQNMPFLVVQLPNYDAGELNGHWQIIRGHQAAVLSHENTALIITNDIGEDNDVHPLNKRDVAYRLAEGILHLLRGDDIRTDKVVVNAGGTPSCASPELARAPRPVYFSMK